jgi:lipoyl(octanoyl) transferase
MPYGAALDLQRAALEATVAARDGGPGDGMAGAGRVYLVEHDPPVITVTRRPGAGRHVLASPGQLAETGVQLCETDRGGDVTYHGPGQLVVYPILDLNALGLRIHGYMRMLEEVVIRTLADFGVEGYRDACATGVWVGGSAVVAPACGDAGASTSVEAARVGGSKICAMGVRVSRWVAMHGLALNVAPELSHVDLIVPCGLHGRTVTSLRRELGDAAPGMDRVKASIVGHLRDLVRARRAATASRG